MNFTIVGILLITILGASIRIIGIDKDGGLWNDEYVSWAIAAIPFGKEFIKGMLTQCHMPLYYLYLKFFNIFSSDDTYLRITSLVPSVLAIPMMFLVGKEKSKFSAFACAFFTAVSSLLVYYAQEVRFYSLLFLFSSISLYFTIRTVKKPDRYNIIGLVTANLLILLTHTIGFVYVFFNILYIYIKLRKSFKSLVNKLAILSFILIALVSPIIVKILFLTNSMSQWWTNINLYRVVQIFADFFTPIISNVSVIENIHSLNIDAVCLIIPMLIALVIYIAGFVDKNLRNDIDIIYIAIATIIISLLAGLTGSLSLDAKYIIEIYPILIFTFCVIIDSYDRIWFKYFVLITFFLFQVLYIFSPNYAAKLPRYEGNKYVADLIKSAKLNKNDFIVLTYYPKSRFEKYIDFSKYNVYEIYKGNFNYFYEPFMTSEQALKDGKNRYRAAFINSTLPLNQYSESLLMSSVNRDVYSKMKKNQKVAFIFLDSVAFLDEYLFRAVVTNPASYKKAALPYLVFSNIRNEIIKTIPLNIRDLKYEVKGAWTVVSFKY